MKIAIYHDLPSGGAKRALYEIARRLGHDHRLDLYTLSSADSEFGDLRPLTAGQYVYPFQALPLLGSPFGRLNQWRRRRDLGCLDRLARQIAGDIDRGGYDAVYCHHSMWTKAPAVLGYLKTPTLYHIQEPLRQQYEPPIARPYDNQGWRRRADRLDPLIAAYRRRLAALDRAYTARATRLVANSRFSAANIQRAYGRPAELCYLGVDGECFRPLPAISREKALLSVGALRPNKGFDFLVEALGRLDPAVRPPLRLVANADDPLEAAYLRRLAAERGVTLTIETKVSDETLVRRYNQAAVVVYAPVREPFGFVPLEAMACGRPIVAVAEGGVAESVEDGRTGLLVERSTDHFAAALTRLLTNPALAEQLGQQGRRQALDRWSWKGSAECIERHLAEVGARL
jgi:glycosyltransferase involved in cell wall biosynthesis